MGLVVRPERKRESNGIPASFRSQMSGCTSATAMKTEQTTWTAHPAWSAWSEESAAVIVISATIVSSGLAPLRCARAKPSASPAPMMARRQTNILKPRSQNTVRRLPRCWTRCRLNFRSEAEDGFPRYGA